MTDENDKNIGAGAGGASTPQMDAASSAAFAAVAQLKSDSNFCNTVCQSGSATNSAIHAFKVAYQAAFNDAASNAQLQSIVGGPPPLPTVGTGQYEQATADAMNIFGAGAPAGCTAPCSGGGPPQKTCPDGQVLDANGNCVPASPTPPGGMKTWVKVLLWVLVAGGVAGTGYLLYRWMQKRSGAAEPRRRKRGRRRKK